MLSAAKMGSGNVAGSQRGSILPHCRTAPQSLHFVKLAMLKLKLTLNGPLGVGFLQNAPVPQGASHRGGGHKVPPLDAKQPTGSFTAKHTRCDAEKA
jgi:hypothetical protein